MARFELHPEAARALNERGEALLSQVGKVTPQQERRPFASQRVPAMVITEADIVGRMTMQRVNEFRKEVTAVEFEGPGPVDVAGLEGEAIKELDKLVQLAQKYLHATTSVSLRFLREALIDWLQERFRREITESLSDFLLARVSNAVALRTILIPIANLCLEEDLPFGPVEFKVVTAQMVDSWYEVYRAAYPTDDMALVDELFARIRKDTQGLAAVAFTVEADEEYACQQCLERAEQAVALLRVIHPANTSPHTALYVRPLGSENIESYYAYHYEDGVFQGRRGQTRWPFPSFWEIPKEQHDERPLPQLREIFAAERRTGFQQRLFDALLIYSRNNLAKEPYEKLIFCLVAVESMLLKDPSEPVQDNIGERMAYILGQTVQERLEIESLVKQIYAIRSKFVHHGQRPTDMDALARFMDKVWVLFFHWILTHSAIETKDQLIEGLRRLKYR